MRLRLFYPINPARENRVFAGKEQLFVVFLLLDGCLFGSCLLGELLALVALDDGVSDDGRDELDRADSVVVTRDDIISVVRVAVGVDDSDDRNAEL